MARPKNTNGKIVDVQKGTFGKIVIDRNHNLYSTYRKLRSDTKSVMDSILTYMQSETNLIVLKGNTLNMVMNDTGYAERTVVNAINELKKLMFIEITHQLPHELIVNPVFAYKDNQLETVWKTYQKVHYKNEVPRSVMAWTLEEE